MNYFFKFIKRKIRLKKFIIILYPNNVINYFCILYEKEEGKLIFTMNSSILTSNYALNVLKN